jgi:hypothetical protein
MHGEAGGVGFTDIVELLGSVPYSSSAATHDNLGKGLA